MNLERQSFLNAREKGWVGQSIIHQEIVPRLRPLANHCLAATKPGLGAMQELRRGGVNPR
jgi:hypothetical protein